MGLWSGRRRGARGAEAMMMGWGGGRGRGGTCLQGDEDKGSRILGDGEGGKEGVGMKRRGERRGNLTYGGCRFGVKERGNFVFAFDV